MELVPSRDPRPFRYLDSLNHVVLSAPKSPLVVFYLGHSPYPAIYLLSVARVWVSIRPASVAAPRPLMPNQRFKDAERNLWRTKNLWYYKPIRAWCVYRSFWSKCKCGIGCHLTAYERHARNIRRSRISGILVYYQLISYYSAINPALGKKVGRWRRKAHFGRVQKRESLHFVLRKLQERVENFILLLCDISSGNYRSSHGPGLVSIRFWTYVRSFARFSEEIRFLIGSFFLLKGKFEFFNQRNGELFHFLSSFFASPCVFHPWLSWSLFLARKILSRISEVWTW